MNMREDNRESGKRRGDMKWGQTTFIVVWALGKSFHICFLFFFVSTYDFIILRLYYLTITQRRATAKLDEKKMRWRKGK